MSDIVDEIFMINERVFVRYRNDTVVTVIGKPGRAGYLLIMRLYRKHDEYEQINDRYVDKCNGCKDDRCDWHIDSS